MLGKTCLECCKLITWLFMEWIGHGGSQPTFILQFAVGNRVFPNLQRVDESADADLY